VLLHWEILQIYAYIEIGECREHVCDHVSFVWETESPSVKGTWNLFNGRGVDACRQPFIPIVHIPPAGVDALVNHPVVSISESIHLPVSRSRA